MRGERLQGTAKGTSSTERLASSFASQEQDRTSEKEAKGCKRRNDGKEKVCNGHLDKGGQRR